MINFIGDLLIMKLLKFKLLTNYIYIRYLQTKKLEPKGRVAKQNKKIYSTLPEIQKITDEILKDSEIQVTFYYLLKL